MTRRILPFFLILFFVFFAGGAKVFALIASDGTDTSLADVSISVSPENPAPNDTVTVSLSSLGTDLSSATISWSVGGTPITSGIGDTAYTFTAKDVGVSTSVAALITTPDGNSTTKSITIDPTSMDVLWQAVDSTVPPLYRGKALPASQGKIKFVAIPEIKSSSGAMIDPSKLVYDWMENFDPSPDDSGYGKSSFTVTTSDISPTENIGVNVSSLDGSATSSGTSSVTPIDPFILWYVDSPLYGPLYNQSLGTDYSVNGSEATLLAEPYFFSPGNPASTDLSYAWTLNGAPIATPQTPNVLFLHRDSSSAGDASLDLSISNGNYLFQTAEAPLTLHLLQ